MTLEDPTKHRVTLRTNNIIEKEEVQFAGVGALLGIAGYDYVIFDGES